MHGNYDDIRSRMTEPPAWFDQNGTPRYGEFHPSQCPNIYSRHVVLAKIACQACCMEFTVEMHAGIWSQRQEAPPSKWHYGDPPCHGCAGDTMNCEDLEILQVWIKTDCLGDWRRRSDLEGIIDEAA